MWCFNKFRRGVPPELFISGPESLGRLSGPPAATLTARLGQSRAICDSEPHSYHARGFCLPFPLPLHFQPLPKSRPYTCMESMSSDASKAASTSFFIFRVAVHPRRIDDEIPSKLWINQEFLHSAHADGLLHNVDRDILVLFDLSPISVCGPAHWS